MRSNSVDRIQADTGRYKSIMCTTKDTGLIWFALRIIHRIIGTKVYLNKLKISDDKYCSICLHEPESITHLFFH